MKCTLRCTHCERHAKDLGLGVKRIDFTCDAAKGEHLGQAVYYLNRLILDRSESPEVKDCLAEGSRNEDREVEGQQ